MPGTTENSEDLLIQPLCAIFRRFLKRQGLKFTTERALILHAVLSKKGVFEAEQLQNEMKQTGHRVSKATIYRTLKHLLDAGIITEVLIDARQSHYELSFGREPKGHLVCDETNTIIEFPTKELGGFIERVCHEHDFEPISHRFVIYGTSREARQKAKTNGKTKS